MFGRLLKHELVNNTKLIKIACLIIIGLGLLTGLASLVQSYTILILAFVGIILAIYAVVAFIIIQIILTFSRNTFNKRGYITFQIPVTSHQIIWSKLLSILISITAIVISIFISLIIVCLFSQNGFAGVYDIVNLFLQLFLTPNGVLALFTSFVSIISNLLMLFYCFAYPNSGGKKGGKVASSILTFFGITYAKYVIVILFEGNGAWFILIADIILSIAFYFTCIHILDKKLELQ